MNLGESIKAARESQGLTQEDLAEKCEVSRQAVSKWELGASVPGPENLALLEEILNVTLETEPGTVQVPSGPQRPNPWKIAVLALGGLMVIALFAVGMYVFSGKPDHTTPADPQTLPASLSKAPPSSPEPVITGVYFFREDGTPLNPDLGDGWNSFTVGERVYLLVDFRQGTETEAYGAALYATPTGTEVYDQREQLAVQAVYDRTFALFPLEFPEETMLHLDVTLECDGGQTVTETLNVTAIAPASPAGALGTEGSTDLPEGDDGVSGEVPPNGPEYLPRSSDAP